MRPALTVLALTLGAGAPISATAQDARPAQSAPARPQSHQDREEERRQRAYRQFLDHVQAAFRARDREAVIASVRFPLRVNGEGGTTFVRTPAELRARFDRVFSADVVRATLAQDRDSIFSRDQGAMVGSGQMWFDRGCADAACTAYTPVRIIAINHMGRGAAR
ncbi:hypothetical protein [Aurantiacibacter spongiae]|uniref:DUF4440 domain-containing protein n=1 Tax=Aurantiacibacter spongiae TaxID=2488860 RepID=A0A3N5DL33_9SPHN|nr:hypothetical protein [Aurantiacibacter spongiae]RPF72402.1 hypothetical protein EG799_12760 [Aurantiacibacter spongiae]